ncbi:aldo/keto reductase [Leucobacter salsicius]|uniref:aldo/keto reductase n=1 Tax=Leucobacter salsicius TaxID=664638 RepID=UPI0003467224
MSTNPVVPTITLNSGAEIPQIGFGVFQVPNDETEAAVSAALEAGYRSIDTAAIYGNEEGVGHAIAASGIAREELFITSKLWNTDQGAGTAAGFESSLEKLGLEWLDLYLIHWPAPANDRYLDTWTAFEEIKASGRSRSIGVSNFLPEHLDRLVALGGTVPAVNQIELHPGLQQADTVAWNRAHGVATEAWSPLAQGSMLANPVVVSLADKLERTPAQVILRWHLQQGRIVIPKSVTPARIAQNLDVFSFELGDTDIAAITALELPGAAGRIGPTPAEFNG